MKTYSISSKGLELLLVAFIVLKLCGVIGWSWWWVLAPFWIPAGFAALVLLVLGLCWIFIHLGK